MSAASAQLSQAIQSILSTSIPSGQQPAPPPAAAATIVCSACHATTGTLSGIQPGLQPQHAATAKHTPAGGRGSRHDASRTTAAVHPD